ncbi:hypothetical protein BLOT_007191 [Blomia tropicalis]|nr:hypothetical protein BLOT_007191 [Blomia tropicalis]
MALISWTLSVRSGTHRPDVDSREHSLSFVFREHWLINDRIQKFDVVVLVHTQSAIVIITLSSILWDIFYKGMPHKSTNPSTGVRGRLYCLIMSKVEVKMRRNENEM